MKMNKKLLALNLCFALLFSAFAVFAGASNANPVYSITVDGTEFLSDTDSSGNGWSYSEGVLTLDSYNGTTIKASGDLTVYTKNNVTISGGYSDVYSADTCGIVVNGTLTLNVDGTTYIYGTDNYGSRGGEAIVAAKAVIYSEINSSFNVYGGNNSVAIKANEIELNTKQMNAYGGDDASAIYFSSSLTVNAGTNAVVKSGSSSKYAITYLKGATYTIDEEDITAAFSDKSSKIVFTSKSNFIYGDTNSDGNVDTKDAVLLAQYIANWKVDIDLNAADTNADGSITTKDAVLLAQSLAGWAVQLG